MGSGEEESGEEEETDAEGLEEEEVSRGASGGQVSDKKPHAEENTNGDVVAADAQPVAGPSRDQGLE